MNYLMQRTRLFIVLVMSSFAVNSAHGNDVGLVEDRHVFANQIARKVLVDVAPERGKSVQLGVLPFADENHRTSRILGSLATEMRGEMIHALQQEARHQASANKGGIQIPSMGAVTEIVQQTSAASVLDIQFDPKNCQQFVASTGLDYILWGKFQVSSGKAALASKEKSIGVHVFLASRFSANTQEYEGRIDKGDFAEILRVLDPPMAVNPPDSGVHAQDPKLSERFVVELLDAQNQPIPMQFVPNPESEYFNSFYVSLSETFRNQPFKIRIADNGGAAVGVVNRDPAVQAKRLHQVAVKLDGINSIWPRTKRGYEPSARHPLHQPKWVLTPPGHILVHRQGSAGLTGADLIPAKEGQSDGSSIEIQGFQAGPDTAKQFVFADDPGESLALTSGFGSKDLGVITVYFYAQQFSKKESAHNYFFNIFNQTSFNGITKSSVPDSSVGSTKVGNELKSPTITVKFDIVPEPVQIWRIFYGYGNSTLTEPDGSPVPLKALASSRG